jgi:hypothetical protein
LIIASVGKNIQQSPGSREEVHMSLWDWWKSLLSRGSPPAASTRRLDGRSKTLLAASIKALPYETPGWITSKEAKQLFSSMDDEYAFGEMDEVGKANIAGFVAHVTPRCSFEFMPVEGRVYFLREANGGGERG